MTQSSSALLKAINILASQIARRPSASQPSGLATIHSALQAIAASPELDPSDLYPLWLPIILSGEPQLLRALTSARAPLNHAPDRQEPPLFIALAQGCAPSFLLLLQAGADPNPLPGAPPSQEPLMHVALRQGESDMALLLLAHGCDPLFVNDNGATYLHYAAHYNNVPVAAALLARGADPLAATREGVTPLSLAERQESLACSELLRSAIEAKELASSLPSPDPLSRKPHAL